ncbi:MAG: GtrA family protein [Paludibacteraceae bacterium]|nr:GtrA family protein [Paludibacteraceae bacterium]
MNAFDKLIITVIDFFYPPFKRLISIDVFRYGVCGGANVVFDWVLYFVLYNFVIRHQNVDLGLVTLSPHIAALAFSFPVSLMTGFYLARHISFRSSKLRKRTQLWRYVSVVGMNILINYLCLKLFVDVMGIYPTPSKMITTGITTVFSFLAQKNFSFKTGKVSHEEQSQPQEP